MSFCQLATQMATLVTFLVAVKCLSVGKELRVVGTVCMDFTMLDITDLDISEKLKLDQPVVVLGQQAGRILGFSFSKYY